jgi:hypothetical protein
MSHEHLVHFVSPHTSTLERGYTAGGQSEQTPEQSHANTSRCSESLTTRLESRKAVTHIPLMAMEPNFVAERDENCPPKDPNGVRAAPTMHTSENGKREKWRPGATKTGLNKYCNESWQLLPN